MLKTVAKAASAAQKMMHDQKARGLSSRRTIVLMMNTRPEAVQTIARIAKNIAATLVVSILPA